jgi:hypothetical protein
MARQTLTPQQYIAYLLDKIAKEEYWLDYYTSAGVAAPKQEETVAQLREELRNIREKAGMRS